MKKLILVILLLCLIIAPVPGHAFLDYLFSGSGSRDAIDNSALGDLRAWWTGNPAYQFNPYYSAPPPSAQGTAGAPGAQQMGTPGSYSVSAPQVQVPQMQQQPNVMYYPPQGGQNVYGQAAPQATQPMYSIPQQAGVQQYQGATQPYQAMPVQQQAAPQNYQGGAQQYYYPAPQAAYQGAGQQYYPAPQAYQGAVQQYQYQLPDQGYPAGVQQ